jgi:aminoglycoside phosphotransferase (APT) family kinase protein
MQGSLLEYCERSFAEKRDLRIKDFAELAQGWESKIYAFKLEYGPETRRQTLSMVLRLYSGEQAYAKSKREFYALNRLYRAGYPVPYPYSLERQNSPFRAPFILIERIAGRPLLPILIEASQKRQRALITYFCDLFVRLHRLEWHQFVHAERGYQAIDPFVFVDRWFILARQTFNHYSKHDFLPVLEWLEKQRNDLYCLEPAPVHLDFHPNNILLRANGSAVVIDWTSFDVSDARFDLAWTLVLSYAYLGMDWRDRILKEYENLWGNRIEQIEVFEVLAGVRRLSELSISLTLGAIQQGMRPEAVIQMQAQKDAYRRVYQLVLQRAGARIPEIESWLDEI